MKLTKKRVVLFLLFIFPLICFLLLSTGINNAIKLPIVNKNVTDLSVLDASKTFKNKVSVICFLGENMLENKGGFFNLNEKIYKKFTEYRDFQLIALFPEGKKAVAAQLKKEIGAFTDMVNWKFVPAAPEEIEALYATFKVNQPLVNAYTNEAFLIDKNGFLRGRTDDIEKKERKILGYNMNSVADLKKIMKDDISALYYEYYAAYRDRNKNKKKADRKF